MTVPDALAAIAKLTRAHGGRLLVGAGTVTDAHTAERAIEAGARCGMVAPVLLVEPLHDGSGTPRVRRQAAMRYAAPTGAADPAPATEYVLVQTTEDGTAAWVEVWAGIDLNPAALGING